MGKKCNWYKPKVDNDYNDRLATFCAIMLISRVYTITLVSYIPYAQT